MSTLARDHYERYYAEKLWALIPEAFREDDGLANPPGVLRAFIETLAINAAVLRRSSDKLWDDQLIELCSEWAVPYIGQLVGTRLISALNRRGRRIDVAKTIYYRRRKGTPRILEELIADITGWEGKLVEEFKRLGRCRHGLDPHPAGLEGKFTNTPPGGWADLRNTRGADLAGTAFDEFHYTPDLRQPSGRNGRYGIAKLGFHLFRLASTALIEVTPRPGPNPGTFTIDPSGRDTPLFIRRNRTDDREIYDWEQWQTAEEWQLPGPMHCRVLNHAEFIITAKAMAAVRPLLISDGGLSASDADAAIAGLEKFENFSISTEAELQAFIDLLPATYVPAFQNETVWEALRAATLITACGKQALLPPGSPDTDTSGASLWIETIAGVATRERIVAGNLAQWTLTVANRDWAIDPDRGRILWVGTGTAPAFTVSCYNGFSGAFGAGGYDRSASLISIPTDTLQGGGAILATTTSSGVTEITDSATYSSIGDRDNLTNLEFRAANRQRPYLTLTQDLTFDTGAHTGSTLSLNGLWLGATGAPRSLLLQGEYETVTLQQMTLDPGGIDSEGNPIFPVSLLVVGHVENLVIDHSIVGPVRLDVHGTVGRIQISDSIVDGQNSAAPALAVPVGQVFLERSTVFGEIEMEWLYASEALITGFADVVNTQAGCFRFSAVLVRRDPSDLTSPHSRVPRPFQSQFLDSTAGWFTSALFGQPGYAQLSTVVPDTVARGAENGSEMGGFSSLLNPIKFDGLSAKVDEFSPFGVLPFYLFET